MHSCCDTSKTQVRQEKLSREVLQAVEARCAEQVLIMLLMILMIVTILLMMIVYDIDAIVLGEGSPSSGREGARREARPA